MSAGMARPVETLIERYFTVAREQGAEAGMAELVAELSASTVAVWRAAIAALLRRQALAAAALLADEGLRAHPQSGALRLEAAHARRLAGDGRGAEALYRSILAVHPQHEAAASGLAFMLRDEGRYRAACEVISQHHATLSDDVEATLRAAQFLLECRDQAAALEVCERTLSSIGEHPRLTTFAGRMALALGRFDAAQRYLRSAIAEAPVGDQAELWYLLVQSRRYEAIDDPDLGRLLELVNTGKAGPAAAFAFGKALDDVGRYADAARYFAQGNAAVATVRRWRARIDQAPNPCPVRLDRQPAGPAPIFVIGLPRSGTTLVAEQIARHPDVLHRGELNWLAYLDRELARGQAFAERSALQQAQSLYLRFLRQDDAPPAWIIDKNPLNFRYLSLIDALFPDARIVLCHRDPRDAALSMWQQLFASGENDYAYREDDLRAFILDYQALVGAVLPTLRLPVIEVRYEDFVQRPEFERERIWNALGLAATKAPATGSTTAIATASLWQARQPVYQRAVARWQRYAEYLPWLSTLGSQASRDE